MSHGILWERVQPRQAAIKSRLKPLPPIPLRDNHISYLYRLNVKADNYPFFVGQVADDFLDRFRKPAHQRRHDQNLVTGGELRVLDQVDDFNAVLTIEEALADALEVGESRERFWGLASNIESQLLLDWVWAVLI